MPRFIIISLAIALLLLTAACSTARVAEPSQADASNAEIQPSGEGSAPAAEASSAAVPAVLVENLKSVLSTQTGIPTAEIMFKSAEAVDWPDACLGISEPGQLCAQVVTPGYRIRLGSLTEEYEFHTDQSGQAFRLVSSGSPEAGEAQPEEGKQGEENQGEPEQHPKAPEEPTAKEASPNSPKSERAGEEMEKQGK